MPIIKNYIIAFQTWTNKWGEELNLKILADSKISIKKYLALREDYKKNHKILEAVINEEKQYQEESRAFQNQYLDSQRDLNQTKQQLDECQRTIRQVDNLGLLDGIWVVTYKSEGQIHSERININASNSHYTIETAGAYDSGFYIRDFCFNVNRNRITFIKEATEARQKDFPDEPRYAFQSLHYSTTSLSGYENGAIQVGYTRPIEITSDN
jgi:hypothetical protein